MVIIKLMGGLGNQMQQYALYQKFISLGTDAYLDTEWYSEHIESDVTERGLELDIFDNAGYKTASHEMIERITGKNSILGRLRSYFMLGRPNYICENSIYRPDIFDMDNVYLEGYWSVEKYYADIMTVLRDRFRFVPELRRRMKPEATDMEHRILGEAYPCSVHIRRGDYLNAVNVKMFGGIATEAYYESAFDLIRSLHPKVCFFIFSDDTEYIQNRYGDISDCVIVDVNRGGDSIYDIYLMSLCSAHICANSSFSYWGARLDAHHGTTDCAEPKHISIRPSVHTRGQKFDKDTMNDLWKGWTFIDPRGAIM